MKNTSINREDDTKELDLYGITAKRPCPFYGFDLLHNIDNNPGKYPIKKILKDNGGSWCALTSLIKENSYFPLCLKGEVNWDTCPFNSPENREKLEKHLNEIAVFPKILETVNGDSWNGLPLGVWMKHVNGTYNLK